MLSRYGMFANKEASLVLIALVVGLLLPACSSPETGLTVVSAVTSPSLLPDTGLKLNNPTPTPTASPAPPTPVPTATLAAQKASEWGVIKGSGATVRSEANGNAPILEKLSGFTLVAFERKLVDESWWERAGGGWLSHDEVVVYSTEREARRNLPRPTPSPTAVPTYNPNQPPTVDVKAFKQALEATVRASAPTAKPAPSNPQPVGQAGILPYGQASETEEGGVKISTKYNYYSISGATSEELHAQINQLGPLQDGSHWAGMTQSRYSFSYQYQQNQASCSLRTVKVQVEIVFVMPRWDGSPGASAELVRRWNSFNSALQTHENGHREIIVQNLKGLYNTLVSLSPSRCDQLKARLEGIVSKTSEQIDAQNAQYDDQTQHGLKQGTIL